jgi:hypothetical protein
MEKKGFMVKAWLKSAVRHEPKINDRGDRILFYSPVMLILSLIWFLFCLCFIGWWLIDPISKAEGNTSIYYFIIFAFMFLYGIYSFLEWKYHNIVLSNEGVINNIKWAGHSTKIIWGNIAEVTLENTTQAFIIIDNNNNKIRVNTYFYGIKSLADEFRQRLPSSVYQKINDRIILFDKLSSK